MGNALHSRTSAEDLQDRLPANIRGTKDELLVDQAALESFPASDVPSWAPIHAGSPCPSRPKIDTPRHLSSRLRKEVESLVGADIAGRNEIITTALLDADRAVNRIPLASKHENIEVAIRGVAEGPELIVGARYDDDDPTGIASLLGLACVLEGRRFARTVRLVAFADGAEGAKAYAERLRTEKLDIRGMLALERLAFSPHDQPRVTFLSNLRSRGLVEEARDAFRTGTQLHLRTLALPFVFPLARNSDHRAFSKHGWLAAVVTNRARHVKLAKYDLNYDASADVVFGLAAVIARLCGGEGH